MTESNVPPQGGATSDPYRQLSNDLDAATESLKGVRDDLKKTNEALDTVRDDNNRRHEELRNDTGSMKEAIISLRISRGIAFGVVGVLAFLLTGGIIYLFTQFASISDSLDAYEKNVAGFTKLVDDHKTELDKHRTAKLEEIEARSSLAQESIREASRSAETGLLKVTAPIGTVVAYACPVMSEKDREDLFQQGWLVCDGGLFNLKEPKYKPLEALRAKLGDSYATKEADVDLFRVPDYRGYFLRGLDARLTDEGTPVDVGREDREFMFSPGRKAGAVVGSVQLYATALPRVPFVTSVSGEHSHQQTTHDEVSARGGTKRVQYEDRANGNRAVADHTMPAGNHSHTVDTGGDPETRPSNVAVHWLIRFR